MTSNDDNYIYVDTETVSFRVLLKKPNVFQRIIWWVFLGWRIEYDK